MADRENVITHLKDAIGGADRVGDKWRFVRVDIIKDVISLLTEQPQDVSKYQYKIDHTDCLWYNNDNWNQCPSTCSQYRDGWNDAMDYIYKGGKGYQPYKRG